MMFKRTQLWALALIAASVVGCESSGSSAISVSPDDWTTLAGKKMTFEGLAGNSQRGPLLRFEDSTMVGLANFNLWPVTIVSRPVGIVGTVAVGEGSRRGEYVVQVERWYLLKKPMQPSPVSQEPYIEESPIDQLNKKKSAK